jgi:hypothetical protein
MESYRTDEKAELLPLSRRLSENARPLSATSMARARALAALMLQGVSFDPVLVVIGADGRFAVINGHHRAAASVLAGFECIPVITNEERTPNDRR